MTNTNTCKHDWKFFDEYIYMLDANEAAFCPIYKCAKCGKIVKSEDMDEKEIEAITPPVEWIPYDEL